MYLDPLDPGKLSIRKSYCVSRSISRIYVAPPCCSPQESVGLDKEAKLVDLLGGCAVHNKRSRLTSDQRFTIEHNRTANSSSETRGENYASIPPRQHLGFIHHLWNEKGKEKGVVRVVRKIGDQMLDQNSRITRRSIEIVESILLRIADDQFLVGNQRFSVANSGSCSAIWREIKSIAGEGSVRKLKLYAYSFPRIQFTIPCDNFMRIH